MNKSELIKAIADRSGLTQVQAGLALDAFCATVIDEMSKEGDVSLTGFGSFTVAERAERMGVNPKTKEPMIIPATKVVKFKAGKALKDVV